MMQLQNKQKEKKLSIFMVIAAVVLIAAPGFGKTYSFNYLSDKQDKIRRLEGELAQYELDITGIDERRQLLQANRQDYLKWVNRGVVGEQKPVKWVKLMDRIQRSRGLFEVSYDFEGEQEFPPESFSLTADSTVRMVFWEMDLDMGMLHDLDVFMFLNDLREGTGSFFFPFQCSFSRETDDFQLTSQENMQASCAINWVSVKDPARKIAHEEGAAESGNS